MARSSRAKSLSRDPKRSAVLVDKSKQVRESKQLRKTKQSAFHYFFSAFLHMWAHYSERIGPVTVVFGGFRTGIEELKDEELKLRVKKQQLEQKAEIEELRKTVEQLAEQGGLTRSQQILRVDED